MAEARKTKDEEAMAQGQHDKDMWGWEWWGDNNTCEDDNDAAPMWNNDMQWQQRGNDDMHEDGNEATQPRNDDTHCTGMNMKVCKMRNKDQVPWEKP